MTPYGANDSRVAGSKTSSIVRGSIARALPMLVLPDTLAASHLEQSLTGASA
jgi:hypothetical protein